MEFAIVFVLGMMLGFVVGWYRALDIVIPKITRAVQLLKGAGVINEDLIAPEELQKIFKEADGV